MRHALSSSFVIALASSHVEAQTTHAIVVDSVVVDPAGTPLVGARLGDIWHCREGAWTPGFLCPNPHDPLVLTSDRDGRIRGTWTLSPGGVPLFALSADGAFATFVEPDWPEGGAAATPARITAQPAVRLQARLRTSTGAVVGGRVCLQWPGTRVPAVPQWFCADFTGSQLDLPLPPHRYEFSFAGGFSHTDTYTVELTAGRALFDLGPITLPTAPFDRIGELLPDWQVDHAANIDLAKARLADFRGRPLLVVFGEFAPFRIGEDVQQGLAELARYARRAEFAVVLFETSIPLAWRSRELPTELATLPMLGDATGGTAAKFGTRWATVVVDADGRLVHVGRSVGEAAAAVAKLLPAK